jgi:hypothetical protein
VRSELARQVLQGEPNIKKPIGHIPLAKQN